MELESASLAPESEKSARQLLPEIGVQMLRAAVKQSPTTLHAYHVVRAWVLVCLVVVAALVVAGLVVKLQALAAINGNTYVFNYISAAYIAWQNIMVDCYYVLSTPSANGTVLAATAQNIQTSAANFSRYINYLEFGNSAANVPARFTDGSVDDVFELLLSQAALVAAAAANITAAVAGCADNVTTEIKADIVGILAQRSVLDQLPPVFWRVRALTLDSVQTATVEVSVFAAVILAVLLAAVIILMWPLERYFRQVFIARGFVAVARTNSAVPPRAPLSVRRMHSDVEERSKQLARMAEDMATLARLSPSGIFRTDCEGNVETANARWLGITGLAALGNNANRWRERVHPDDRAAVDRAWAQLDRDRAALFDLEFRYNRPDGTIVWIHGQAYAERADLEPRKIEFNRGVSEDGDAVCTWRVIGVFSDVTPRKALEASQAQALAQAATLEAQRRDEAMEHQRDQERFVDVVCHEIRNPLNGIVNNADLLRASWRTACAWPARAGAPGLPDWLAAELARWLDDQDAMLGAIELCAAHQRRISEDMLLVSRMHAGKFPIISQPFLVRDIVNSVAQMFTAEAAASAVDLECALADGIRADLCVVGDAQRITQIVVNLVSNALKFVRDAAVRRVQFTLAIHAGADSGQMLLLTVADTGVGMTEAEQAKLFVPFAQANAATYSTYGGSGMGLFISRTLLDLMGGTISVTSRLGVGTAFTVEVPCALATQAELSSRHSIANLADKAPPEAAQPLKSTIGRRPVRILVADDNDINRMVLRRQLEAAAYEVTCVSNGAEAVLAFEIASCDIVLMDVEMPVMGGLEATARIRAHEAAAGTSAGVPIVALSGNGRQEHIDAALAAGMTNYVVKPYEKTQLLAMIERTVRKA